MSGAELFDDPKERGVLEDVLQMVVRPPHGPRRHVRRPKDFASAARLELEMLEARSGQ